MVSNLFAQTFTNYTTADGLIDNNVSCVDIDATGSIWFGTQSGVSVFDGVSAWTDHTTATDTGFVDNTIQAIYCVNSGDVWIGTDFGASYFNGTIWTTYTTADGLGNNQIKCITEDVNGNIWFGTNNGASMYDGVNWTNYGTAEGLPFGGVNSITGHSNGDIWMGTGLSGIRIFDGATFTPITTTDGLIDDRIRSIAIVNQMVKWVGTSEGITVLDNSDVFVANHTTMFTLPAPDTLNPVEDLEIDSQGNIWAGIYVDYLVTEGGVCAYDGSQWIEFHVSDGLIGPVVRELAISTNDDVWVATSTGVSKISDHSVGISENEDVSFSVYPNPANDVVNVRLLNEGFGGTLGLYNTSMQLVKSESFDAGQKSLAISVSDLSSGIYFARFNGQTKKIVLR